MTCSKELASPGGTLWFQKAGRTHGSSEKMSLKEGYRACAAFKASSAIIGIS
ncbi:MAG: hypothetical protein ACOYOE_07780 [Chlorobium sp.]